MKPARAESLARPLLSSLGDRWLHTKGVADAAVSLARRLGEGDDREALVSAAWLHDVGYVPSLVVSGFHPLDGARWLQERGELRLAGLVAHHTGALAEAELRGLDPELAEFPDEASSLTDALAYSDLVTGPQGQRLTPDERFRDIEGRHGEGSVVAVGLRAAWPSLMASVERVERDLLPVGQPR